VAKRFKRIYLLLLATVTCALLLQACAVDETVATPTRIRINTVTPRVQPTLSATRTLPAPPLPERQSLSGNFFEISITGDKNANLHYADPFGAASIECNRNGFGFHSVAAHIGEGWDINLDVIFYGNTGRQGGGRFELSSENGQLLISEGCAGCTYDYQYVFQSLAGSAQIDGDHAGGVFTATLRDPFNQHLAASGRWHCESVEQ
jgi:hypothetical protein